MEVIESSCLSIYIYNSRYIYNSLILITKPNTINAILLYTIPNKIYKYYSQYSNFDLKHDWLVLLDYICAILIIVSILRCAKLHFVESGRFS